MTDTAIVLRRASMSDLEQIKVCAVAAYAPYIPAIGRPPAPMVADFAALIDRQCVVVAMSGQDLAGFAVFFPRGADMFLENVAVDPRYTGQGLGRRLIEACESDARRAGLSRVTLYTNEKMLGNLTLYPYLGYAETDRRTEDGFNRVYFAKDL
ncbi:GNAT family N-acetyltransferase [Marivita hallyeonensis]|uniref:Acetyltransferase (GNAT) family protein n=1 Tax=Marivita hallyeonensis TaxID=996342 RepID=A0A1M5W7M3_9RHOB|nr:GNAT family N-acetyltransferase [Marivita hallyeonensis]SHH83193.1 Acetyltransferase (GNAT) family protein [Marivita hallyeonensis]